MLDTEPLLRKTNFPSIQRGSIDTLQVNLGYLCNLSCTHCHVNAGPKRTELMDKETIDLIIQYLKQQNIKTLDVTGGAPEMNPHFEYLVEAVSELGVEVIDRCNLTILLEPDYQHIGDFLAKHKVIITASLPCYSEQNVSEQRGKGVFEQSISALQYLNTLGYGVGPDLQLHLVYNPNGTFLPPGQEQLQADYKKELYENYGIEFHSLLTIANMPISRYGGMLLSKGLYDDYMLLLKDNFSVNNLENVMCKSLISVDYEGFLYDCDFNQMLNWPINPQHYTNAHDLDSSLISSDKKKMHLKELLENNDFPKDIKIGEHCYGCTAGQGSSCSGALS